MFTSQQARARAEVWVNGRYSADERREVHLREFDGGWIVWSVPLDPAHRTVGDAYGVIDAETGRISLWPPMPMEELVRRYHAEREQADRFPAEVDEALDQGGWHPGRRRQQVDVADWVERVSSAAQVEYHLFEAARRAVEEFAGIWVEPPGRPSFALGQSPRGIDHQGCQRLRRRIRRRIMPLGTRHDPAPGTVVIDESGTVYLVGARAATILGPDIDTALVQLCTGPDPALATIGLGRWWKR